MRTLNKVMLYGNLTSDPEVRQGESGRSFTTFSVATNRGWKNREGKMVTETNFHRVVAFSKLGEITGKYLKKGQPVIVSGRLNNRSYTAQDGGKRYVTEIVLDDFNFVPRAKALPEEAASEEEVQASAAAAVV